MFAIDRDVRLGSTVTVCDKDRHDILRRGKNDGFSIGNIMRRLSDEAVLIILYLRSSTVPSRVDI